MQKSSDTVDKKSTATCFVLAGGLGERLRPLTETRPKPLLAFGAVHTLLDFTLSNVRNSGLDRAWILTQYRHEEIRDHIQTYWSRSKSGSGTLVADLPPAPGRRYRGTADAVAQNLDVVAGHDDILVLSADHVYKMDYRPLLAGHTASGAGVTVAAISVPLAEASHFGVISADADGRILRFDEKPESPTPAAGCESRALVNMGVYVFDATYLRRALAELRENVPALDFGRHLLPWMTAEGRAAVYTVPAGLDGLYWKDVGNLGTYHESHMEFVDGRMGFDTLDPRWPVRWMERQIVRFGCEQSQGGVRSVMAASAVVGDAWVERSVLGPGVVVEDGADVRNTVLLSGARVGAGAAVRNAIVAEGARIVDQDTIGFEPMDDLERFSRTESGVVIVGRRPNERPLTERPALREPPPTRERVHLVTNASGSLRAEPARRS